MRSHTPLLFHAVADTLTTFARDPRHLGGDLGATAILHTWGQNLSQHLHLHCVVTGGALAQVFRGKYLDALRRAFAAGKLVFAGSITALAERGTFAAWLDQLRQPDWVVYAKGSFAGPEQVLEYLGRYTHHVALSNDRILSFDDGIVRFRWKDYADGDRVKVMALEATEFLRRFLLHVGVDRLPTTGGDRSRYTVGTLAFRWRRVPWKQRKRSGRFSIACLTIAASRTCCTTCTCCKR